MDMEKENGISFKKICRWISGGRPRVAATGIRRMARAGVRLAFIVHLYIPGMSHIDLWIYVFFSFFLSEMGEVGALFSESESGMEICQRA